MPPASPMLIGTMISHPKACITRSACNECRQQLNIETSECLSKIKLQLNVKMKKNRQNNNLSTNTVTKSQQRRYMIENQLLPFSKM